MNTNVSFLLMKHFFISQFQVKYHLKTSVFFGTIIFVPFIRYKFLISSFHCPFEHLPQMIGKETPTVSLLIFTNNMTFADIVLNPFAP